MGSLLSLCCSPGLYILGNVMWGKCGSVCSCDLAHPDNSVSRAYWTFLSGFGSCECWENRVVVAGLMFSSETEKRGRELERWFSGEELLFSQRTYVQFSASWWFTSICNSNLWDLMPSSGLCGYCRPMVQRQHADKTHIHINKNSKKFKRLK